MSEVRLIDADTLHYAFDDEGADLCLSINMKNMWGFSYDSVHTLINKAPTVDAVPVVHGHWILLDNCLNEGHYCSVCNKKIGETTKFKYSIHKYCPNCGAKMDEVEE